MPFLILKIMKEIFSLKLIYFPHDTKRESGTAFGKAPLILRRL